MGIGLDMKKEITGVGAGRESDRGNIPIMPFIRVWELSEIKRVNK